MAIFFFETLAGVFKIRNSPASVIAEQVQPYGSWQLFSMDPFQELERTQMEQSLSTVFKHIFYSLYSTVYSALWHYLYWEHCLDWEHYLD